jgi:hypothetical protein
VRRWSFRFASRPNTIASAKGLACPLVIPFAVVVIVIVAIAIMTPGIADAETERVAIVVGNNAGLADQAPLRYAEEDAGKMARVLVELGGVDEEHLQLLQGRSLAEVRSAFERARQQVETWHRRADVRVISLFYFSGHSDGESLELGHERLTYAELRAALNNSGAEVKLAIVDSCKSGALLATKGGTLGPAFQIRLADDLASTGEAMLTSSAADELALESREIRGSYFTHHLVSGLRGAADASGDGRVTLSEAYRYAFDHTVSATATAETGPQHPAYDYHLSGEGELVITDLSKPSASLELPEGFERALVVQLSRDQVMAELASGAARKVAIEPGGYAVQAWRRGQLFQQRLTLASGEHRTLAWTDLVADKTALPSVGPKGSEPLPVAPTSTTSTTPTTSTSSSQVGRPLVTSTSGPDLELGLGAQAGIAHHLGPLPSLRVALHAHGSGLALAAQLDAGRGAGSTGVGFSETTGLVWTGYRWGIAPEPFGAFLGVGAGGGLVLQTVDGQGFVASVAGVAMPEGGVSLGLGRSFVLSLELALPVVLVREDETTAVQFLPAGWLSLAVVF